MNYATLREAGIAHLQRLLSDNWTDHNAHDPGITILEQLCFALTDLTYRAGFPIEDLMAEGGARPWSEVDRPRPMLTTGPVNLEDWRKLLIDIPGVRNAWISPVDTVDPNHYRPTVFYDEVEGLLSLEPVVAQAFADRLSLQGLYNIDFVLEESHLSEEISVKTAIRHRFHAHRGLCEDLHHINKLDIVPISVNARIDIGEVADPEGLLANIYDRIRSYLAPTIRFYTLQEMQARGYLLDEIMAGPRLTHGYLEAEELRAFDLRQHIRVSDLIRLIMDLDGVRAVHSLQLTTSDGKTASTSNDDPWDIILKSQFIPALLIPAKTATPGIVLQHNGLKQEVNWGKSCQQLEQLIQKEGEKKRRKSFAELEHQAPIGEDREIARYQSILHQFPEVYGVGKNGLPEHSSPQRHAQARQLQAYLQFFDQILANVFSQLAATRQLFGLDRQAGSDHRTYFAQSLLEDAPGLAELVQEDDYTEFVDKEGVEDKVSQIRKKRLIQHLLARFGEGVADFSAQDFPEQIQSQQTFLQHYATTSYRRFTAFDYSQEAWESENVSGLKQRLCQLLGFPEEGRRGIAGLPETHAGAFHLLEHILLRPVSGDVKQRSPILLLPFNGDEHKPPQKDPYSLQLSFVFPDWFLRLDKSSTFWPFLVRTLREQTPAHIRIYLHRLSEEEMTQFEIAYQEWLIQLQQYAVS